MCVECALKFLCIEFALLNIGIELYNGTNWVSKKWEEGKVVFIVVTLVVILCSCWKGTEYRSNSLRYIYRNVRS